MENIKELGLQLAELQRDLHNQNKGVLIIFEGLEASGKGTAINSLLQHLDPRGYRVFSNEGKNEEEKMRAFMWKYWNQFPHKGQIAVLDRSYYYELFKNKYKSKIKRTKYNEYLDIIDDTEKTLVDQGIIILKIFLNIDKKTQLKRLKTLNNNPNTTWRVNKKDFKLNKDYEKMSLDYKTVVNSSTLPFFEVDSSNKDYLNNIFKYIIDNLKNFNPNFDSVPNGFKDLPIDFTKYDVPYDIEKTEYEKLLTKYQTKLRDLQHKLYDKRVPLIVVFEGIDAAGKGGTIKRLVENLDPRGYDVIPVSAPSSLEKSHHYLWRFWKEYPKNGHIAVFDRSWYGRVLVERVEGFCSENEWQKAFTEINQMESEWSYDKAIVVKYFITISKEVQLKRFEDRKANKPWKITDEDWRNRERWDDYLKATGTMLNLTNKDNAPWIVIPNNNKYFGRLEVLKSLINIIEKKLK